MIHFGKKYPVGLRAVRRTAGLAERGFSLIELMIALVMGLVVMVALIAVYLNISRSNAEMVKANGLIENGRFAIDILQADLEHAGYWGGYVPDFDDLSTYSVPVATPTASPDPCLPYTAANWTATVKNNLLGIAVQVYGGIPAGCTTSLPSLITSRKTGTDVMVVRHAETCTSGSGGNCSTATAGELYFQTSRCSTEIAVGSNYILAPSSLTLHKRDCLAVEDKRKYLSNIYYIRDYASVAGDGVPTLMRSSFGSTQQSTPVALIEGIEGFVVELGIDDKSRCNGAVNYASASVVPPTAAASDAVQRVDPALSTTTTCTVNTATGIQTNTLPPNRGDGVPESYVHCTGTSGCTAAQLSNAVVAKIYVLARSRDKTTGYTDSKTYQMGSVSVPAFGDNYKRHVFQSTVRLTNVAARRETP